MFLATTALTEFWDKERELLMLGQWCLRHDRRAEWAGLSYQVLPCLWDDRARFHAASAEVDAIYEQVLPWFGERLADLHSGPSRASRYWRIIIGPWLWRFIHSIYDRYQCIRAALDRDPGLDTWTLAPEDFVTPFNAGDFIHLTLDDPYNLQLFTQVFQALGFSFQSRNFTVREVKEAATRGLRARLARIEAKCIDWMTRHPGHVALCEMYCDRRDLWRLVLGSRLRARPIRLPALRPSTTDLDLQARLVFGAAPVPGEFGHVLGQILPCAIPRVYVEDFSRLQKTLPDGTKRPRVVVSANGWNENEGFKLYAADCMDHGSVLAAAQHGGAYGTFLLQPQERHEVQATGAFFTWGWKYQPAHRPMPSMQLSRFAAASSRRRATSETLLMVTNIVPRYVHRFESVPMAAQFCDYMAWQSRFLLSLGSLSDRLTIRVHQADLGQGVKQRIRDAHPGARFDSNRPSVQALADARLVIIDHPVTTMLESLVMNRPTILFWEPKWWEERSEARLLFKLFRDQGMLFDSPEAAAEKVRDVVSYAEEWWSSDGIQKARQEMQATFARTSPIWYRSWLRAFKDFETTRGGDHGAIHYDA
jgi:putative transferase (TIGR04331 family)